jgi:hypothetical protein
MRVLCQLCGYKMPFNEDDQYFVCSNIKCDNCLSFFKFMKIVLKMCGNGNKWSILP